jgi:hypothetical protein
MPDEIVADAVFDRIRHLYGLPSDAAMARKLGIHPQDVPRQRKTGNLPYKQILMTCPPEDWPFIFLEQRPKEPGRSAWEAAAAELRSKGLRMILEPLPAPQAPGEGLPRTGSNPKN